MSTTGSPLLRTVGIRWVGGRVVDRWSTLLCVGREREFKFPRGVQVCEGDEREREGIDLGAFAS